MLHLLLCLTCASLVQGYRQIVFEPVPESSTQRLFSSEFWNQESGPRSQVVALASGPAARYKRSLAFGSGGLDGIYFNDYSAGDRNEDLDLLLTLPIQGREVKFSVRRADLDLLDPHFVYRDSFGRIRDSPPLETDCYYTSRDGDAMAVISLCDGIRGIVSHWKKVYSLDEVPQVEYLSGRRIRRQLDDTRIYTITEIQTDFGDRIDVLPFAPGFHPVAPSLHEKEPYLFKRKKRQATRYTIELAVFADASLHEYVRKRYPSEDTDSKVFDFVMTVLHGVQRLYKEPSLQKDFQIVVKRLEILDSNTVNSHKGDVFPYLKEFCKWQSSNNPQGTDRAWDHALLVTGKDVYYHSHSESATVGLAYVGGMCTSAFSCTLSEGLSFVSTFIITHEMGHSLGMLHDGDSNDCEPDVYIMSSIIASGASSWSQCSRKEVNQFLKENGQCLKESSSDNLSTEFGSNLPGQKYSADAQCYFMYGKGWKNANKDNPSLGDICEEIWCSKGKHYRSPSSPALDGTSCAENKICLRGKCSSTSTHDSKNTKLVIQPNMDDSTSVDGRRVIYTHDSPSGRSIDKEDSHWHEFITTFITKLYSNGQILGALRNMLEKA